MIQLPTPHRYGALLIGLHWFMALLLIAVYSCIEFRGIFPKGSEPRELMKAMHFMLGISVLLLVIIRIAVRLSTPTPPILPAPGKVEKIISIATHLALYLFMILLPIMGWVMLSAAGKPIPFFGMELPHLIAEDKALAKEIMELHEQLGKFGYLLIGIHALAGLFHHYLKCDNTLVRILPGRTQQ